MLWCHFKLYINDNNNINISNSKFLLYDLKTSCIQKISQRKKTVEDPKNSVSTLAYIIKNAKCSLFPASNI